MSCWYELNGIEKKVSQAFGISPGGGAFVFEVGYHPRKKKKKITLLGFIFQDQAMYTRTLFKGCKNVQIWKKECVFGHIDKFWKGHDRRR